MHLTRRAFVGVVAAAPLAAVVAVRPSTTPVTDYIERCIARGVVVPPGRYQLERTIIVRKGQHLELRGSDIKGPPAGVWLHVNGSAIVEHNRIDMRHRMAPTALLVSLCT